MSQDPVNQANSVAERLFLSVRFLAIGEGDVRSRLKGVFLQLWALQEHEFPEELRADFRWVMEQFSRFPSSHPEYETDVEVTLAKIKNATGKKIAERVFGIYTRVQQIRGFPVV